MSFPLFVKKLVSTAYLPKRGSQGAAGYDVSACLLDADNSHRGPGANGQVTLEPGQRLPIPTGISLRVPDLTYGRVGPRSGLAVKNGLDVMAGIVDQDYSGEVAVVLINLGQEPFTLKHGDRIAQIVIEAIQLPDVVEVDSLPTTDRGAGGFGSTGL